MNIILHKYKPFKKGKTFFTIGFISFIKGDVFDKLDQAARKIDNLLGYNKYTRYGKIGGKNTTKEEAYK